MFYAVNNKTTYHNNIWCSVKVWFFIIIVIAMLQSKMEDLLVGEYLFPFIKGQCLTDLKDSSYFLLIRASKTSRVNKAHKCILH